MTIWINIININNITVNIVIGISKAATLSNVILTTINTATNITISNTITININSITNITIQKMSKLSSLNNM